MKYFKYSWLLYKLYRAECRELEVECFCLEIGIDFDDLNLRAVRKARDKIKATWLRRNLID